MHQGRRYEILSLLGQGGFGAVYRARMTGDGGFTKMVALKILKQELSASSPMAQRLRDEARLLGLVHHRAIIQVDALVELDERWTVVMELVEGRDLKAILDLGPVPLGPALELAAEVAGALHAAWTTPGPDGDPLHLLHRDIKPANLCLTPLGEVKVLDFGISRAEGAGTEGQTGDNAYGTPEYMAPERFRTENGPAADIYALGVTLFEILSGERLGRALPRPHLQATLVENRLEQLRARSPETPPELIALLGDLFRFAPEDRPNAREVERRLVRIRRVIEGPTLKDWAERIVPPLLTAQRRATAGIAGTVLYEQRTRTTEQSASPRWPVEAAHDAEQNTWMIRDEEVVSTAPMATPGAPSSTGGRTPERERPWEGRDTLMHEMDAAIDAAERSEASVVLLVGEAGIGKTRLADEGGRRAAARGFGVAWGRCWEAGEAPAGWPWSEALGRIYAEAPEIAAALPGLHRAALRALVPEIDAPAIAARSPEEERLRLASAILAWLEAAGAARPWWIVLDDLHAADPLSLFLLRGVGRALQRARVVLACTWRDAEVAADPALSTALAELSRRAMHVPVPRLDRAATVRLLARLLPGASPTTVEALWQSTLGQPLFVVEMARLVQTRGPDALSASNIPVGVREAVRLRMERLPEHTRSLLEAGALIGPAFELDLLAEVEGVSEPEALRRARDAEQLGILERSATGRRFSHPLIRRAFDEPIDPERRLMLHRNIALALERRPSSPTALRARHWRSAGPEHALQATNAAIEASAAAINRFAWEEAVGVVEATREALQQRDPELDARLLIQEGLARVRLGQLVEGRALCQRAAEHARALDQPILLAAAALAYGGDVVEAEVNGTLIRLLREALQTLPPSEPVQRARVLARLAGAMQPAADPSVPLAMAQEALDTPVTDPASRLEILVGAVSAMVEQALPARYLPLNQEALALTEKLGDATMRLRLLLRLTANHWELGDMARAKPFLHAYAAGVEESGLPSHRRRLTALRAGIALAQGRFDESEVLYREAITMSLAAGDRRRASVLRVIVGMRQTLMGDVAGALRFWEALAEDLAELGTLHPMIVLSAIPARMALGQVDQARRVLETQIPLIRASRYSSFGTHAFSAAIIAVGHVEAAAPLYERLLPWRGAVTGAPAFLGFVGESIEASLGRLALLLGRPEAREHLLNAAAWCDGAEAPAVKAWLLGDLARAQRRDGLVEDAARSEAAARRLKAEMGIL